MASLLDRIGAMTDPDACDIAYEEATALIKRAEDLAEKLADVRNAGSFGRSPAFSQSDDTAMVNAQASLENLCEQLRGW